MGKQQSPQKKAEAVNLGKGKVTPVQIAFIVDRYLADSGYPATLASFRSEAGELFSKTRNREAPRGLLSLAAILDDYVTLKEQRIVVDQEKQRVEALLRGIQESVQAYRSTGGDAAAGPSLPSAALPSPSLPTPSPPPVAARPMAVAVATSNPRSRSPTGSMVHSIPVLRSPSLLVPSNTLQSTTLSTPIAEASCSNKRKNAKPALRAPAAPKKFCGRSQTEASTSEGIPLPSQSHDTNVSEETFQRLPPDNLACIISHQNPCSSVPGSSVAKSLFKQLPDCQTSSTSPKTPPKATSSQADKMGSPVESLSVSHNFGANTCKLSTPSKCSVISSRTVVVSPLKNKGYYAVEKSYCISSSPMKSNLIREGKRDNVKGRLDFDDPDIPICSAKSPAAETSSSSTDDAIEDMFDLDLPDLDIDFSFSELLVNMDLDGQEFGKSYQLASKPSADFITGTEGDVGRGCLAMNQEQSDAGRGCLAMNQEQSASLPGVSGIICEEGMKIIEGTCHDSVTSMKSITKRIQIVSPAKSERNHCKELTEKQNDA